MIEWSWTALLLNLIACGGLYTLVFWTCLQHRLCYLESQLVIFKTAPVYWLSPVYTRRPVNCLKLKIMWHFFIFNISSHKLDMCVAVQNLIEVKFFLPMLIITFLCLLALNIHELGLGDKKREIENQPGLTKFNLDFIIFIYNMYYIQ